MTTNLNDKPMMAHINSMFKKEWNSLAFVDYGTDIAYTHKEVFEIIAKFHLVYELYGIKPGDKIAICDKNSSDWAISLLSIFTYQAVGVPLLADFHIDQIENLTKHSESKLLITNSNVYERASNSDKDRFIDITTFKPFAMNEDRETPLTKAYEQADKEFKKRYPNGVQPEDVHFAEVDLESLALISYTSGSTGNPKGVMLPYRTFWSNVLYCHDMLPVPNEDDKYMSILPMAHMYGFSMEFLYPMTTGRPVYLLTRIPSPQVLLKAFADVRPLMVITVPLIVEKIIQGIVFPRLRTTRMKILTSIPLFRRLVYKKMRGRLIELFGGRFQEMIFGGAAVNKDVDTFLHKIKFPCTTGYGMTECAPLISYVNHKYSKVGSCGRVVDRMEVKVLSDDPQNKAGELVVRGTNVMTGYFKNPEATAEIIDKDGWLHTGDLVTIDSEGFIFIRGRKKNMLLGANGQNVYPEEIEDVILSNTIADECVLVQRDQKFVALVYVNDATMERNKLQPNQLQYVFESSRHAVNELLPKFAQLTSFEVRAEEFEKTPKKNIKRYLYK